MFSSFFRYVFFALPVATSEVAHSIEIQSLKTDSGIRALLVEDYTVPLVALSFSFKGGSSQDADGFEGTSQVLTTMLDEGAGDLDSSTLQRRLDDIGLIYRFNSYRDSFTGSMKTLVENLDSSSLIFSLMLTSPRFDSEPLGRMRDVAIQGLRRAETDPSSLLSRALRQSLYASHPYSRPPSGTLATIDSITPSVLSDYHRRIFARDNLHIGIVGAISAERATSLIQDIFGALPAEGDLSPITDATITTGSVEHIDLDVPQTTISISLAGIKRDDPDFYAAVLVNHILGGSGFSARLFNEVREKRGLAYGAYSSLSTYDYGGLIQASSATGADRADETIAIIRSELKRMASDGPTSEELQAAKNYIIGSYGVQNLDTSDKIASVLVAIQREGLGSDYIDQREKYLSDVSLSDAKRVSSRLYGGDPTLITVGRSAR